MRTNFLLATIAAVFLTFSVTGTDARPRPKRNTKKFEANKTFGLGLMFGTPSGLSGKYYLSSDTALDFGVATHRHGRDRYHDAWNIHADFLWHPFVLASPDAFWLPLYVGVGARLLDHRYDGFGDDLHLGVRAPIGLLIDFNNVPLDIFMELAFIFDVLHDDNHGYTDGDFFLGVRYYFE